MTAFEVIDLIKEMVNSEEFKSSDEQMMAIFLIANKWYNDYKGGG